MVDGLVPFTGTLVGIPLFNHYVMHLADFGRLPKGLRARARQVAALTQPSRILSSTVKGRSGEGTTSLNILKV